MTKTIKTTKITKILNTAKTLVYLNLFSKSTTATTIQIDFNPVPGALQLLTQFIPDTAFISKILDHGCWCAKFNPESLPFGLGGSTTVDELDSICKEWAHSRWCTHVENSGSCDGYSRSSGLNYTVESTSGINIGLNNSFCPDADNCLSQTCQIDLDFVGKIMVWEGENGDDFVVKSEPVCSLGGGMGDGSKRMEFCDSLTTTLVPTTLASTTSASTTLAPTTPELSTLAPTSLSSTNETQCDGTMYSAF